MNKEYFTEITEFINRRFKNEDKWMCGNCYWFAKILTLRFPFLKIYYEPIVGHFFAGTPSQYYDWTGLAEPYSRPILLEEIEKTDPLLYERLLRDCIY